MVDRFLVWMSTGLVTAGVTAAVVAGAGVAMATDGDVQRRRRHEDLGIVGFPWEKR